MLLSFHCHNKLIIMFQTSAFIVHVFRTFGISFALIGTVCVKDEQLAMYISCVPMIDGVLRMSLERLQRPL